MKEVPVEEYTQETEWSCGPAALKILMSHSGHEVSEDQLIQLSGATPAEGATHEGLISAAKQLGYEVHAVSNAGDQLIPHFISAGLPVLVDFQGAKGGHYAVAVGFSDGRIHLEDPRRHGESHHTLDWNIFKAKWFNITYRDRKFINKWMMVIQPK